MSENAGTDPQHVLLLGQLMGKVDSLQKETKDQTTLLQGMDGRLRGVETKAALNGAVSGGLISVGVALLTAQLRNLLTGGPNP